ncbi:MAG: LON peptidase substrate-binding domain-containing protein [Spongiibacteraceae bacterium]
MSVEQDYPLFPLAAPLFPGGRVKLRIFEQRYLDLLRQCLRESSCFAVAWLADGGSETLKPGAGQVAVAEVATEAKIVDWHQTPDGLLAIIIEGGRRCRVSEVAARDSGLLAATVQWLPDLSSPLPPKSETLKALLQQLAEHPQIKGLGMQLQVDEAGALANCLAQLLPIPAQSAYQLLAIDDPAERLDALNEVLDELAGD